MMFALHLSRFDSVHKELSKTTCGSKLYDQLLPFCNLILFVNCFSAGVNDADMTLGTHWHRLEMTFCSALNFIESAHNGVFHAVPLSNDFRRKCSATVCTRLQQSG